MAVNANIAVNAAPRPVGLQPVGAADSPALSLRRWLPRSAAEWVWWAVFSVWSFLPLSKTPVFNLGGLHVALYDVLLICFVVVFLPIALLYRGCIPRAFRWTFIPFTIFTAYGIASAFIFGDSRQFNFPDQVFPILMAWAAMGAGFILVVCTRSRDLEGLALRLAGAITFVAFVYVVVTLFPPRGLRSYVYVDPSVGLGRLSGPLGPSTDLPAVFVIVVSFFVSGIKKFREGIPDGIAGVLLVVAMLLGGSRAGAIALIVLAFAIIMWRMTFGSKILMLVVAVAGAIVAFQIILPDRFLDFEDTLRSRTYETAFVAWTDSVKSLIFGHGYGQIWAWYTHDVSLLLGEDKYYQFYIKTPFGFSVFNAHSVYLNILAELGIVGFSLFALALGSQFIPALRGSIRFSLASRLLPGLLASLVIPAFGALLLKYFPLSAVWWTFFFLMAADYGNKAGRTDGAGRTPKSGDTIHRENHPDGDKGNSHGIAGLSVIRPNPRL